MQLRNTYTYLPAIFAVIMLAIGSYLMPRIDPNFAGIPHISRAEAQKIASDFFQKQGFDPSRFYHDLYFARDFSGLDYLIRTKGVQQTFDLANDEELPLAYWQFIYYRNVPRDAQEELYHLWVSPSGKLVGFWHQLPDSAKGGELTAERATEISEAYLQNWQDFDLSNYTLEKSTSVKKTDRTDYTLVYDRKDERYGEGKAVLQIYVAGERVEGVSSKFQEPANFVAASGVVGGANLLFNTISVAVYVLITIITLAVFLRKYHAGEIGVRQGLLAGLVIFASLILITFNSWSYFGIGAGVGQISLFYKKLIVFGFQIATAYVFMFANTFSAWAAGIHEIRTQKPALLRGLDSVLNRRWLTKNLGAEAPIGIAYGAIVFGGLQIVIAILLDTFGARPRLGYESLGVFSQYLPFGGIVIAAIFSALYTEVIFRGFLIPYLHKWLKSISGAIVTSAAVYALFNIFFNENYSLWPAYYSLVPHFFVGLIQGFVFWRYGLLAAMTSGAIYAGATLAAPLLASDVTNLYGSAALFFVIVIALLAIGLFARWRGEAIDFTPSDEPAHIRRIKERARMQKELEIARRVQLGLLPKTKPEVAGFDIAGVSVPALEVGGDYFDFIHLPNGNLGIAIGDVSGKGVPAAIYMTLTKGILQSHAEVELSPKQVLAKVNSLMYRTIERSWYVSMFYAVLDSQNRILRFARAGHNPAIFFHKDAAEPTLLQPAGIGLGLEMGNIFVKTLVEGELALSAGDTLVFYTDGFTEAMNEKGEEFGEKRFFEILRSRENGTADGLLQHTIAAVREFTGETPQHDDMTMVVLKVY